jgi:RND family efflux transporter MFP subunit
MRQQVGDCGSETLCTLRRLSDWRRVSQFNPIRFSLALLLATWACAVTCTGCNPDDPSSPPRIAVTTLTLTETQASGLGVYTASLEPYEQVPVAFQVAGYVNSIKQMFGADGHPRDIQGGDQVRAGEMLATVKPDTYRAEVSQEASALAGSEATYDRSKRDFDRDSELIKEQIIAPSLFDQVTQQYQSARSEVEQSKAALKQAEINLGYCNLTSPIDGVVLDRRIEVGTLAEPNTLAFDVANTAEMKAVFGISDIEVGRIKQGSLQTLSADALPGVSLIGKVTRIAMNADPTTRTFDVEVTLPNKDGRLRPGMIASLQLADTSASRAVALTLPLNAIVRPPHDSTGFAVYVVEDRDGKTLAHLRNVNLGEIVGNEIRVSNGVVAGDRVIVRGATMVSEGTEVRIIP